MKLQEILNLFWGLSVTDLIGIIFPVILIIIGFVYRNTILKVWGLVVIRFTSNIKFEFDAIDYARPTLKPVNMDIKVDGEYEPFYEVVESTILRRSQYLQLGYESEYIFMRANIYNTSSIRRNIEKVIPEVISEKNLKLEFISSQSISFGGHRDKEVLPIPFTLEPNKTYSKYLCFKIINFPSKINKVKIEIIVKDEYDKSYKKKMKIRKNEDKVLLL